MRFAAKVKDGIISWHNSKGLKDFLATLDGEVYIYIKPSNTRNSSQNNYYWAMLDDLAPQLGYYSKELHKIFKNEFMIDSTTELSENEFSDYLDKIVFKAAELGFPIKDPRRS